MLDTTSPPMYWEDETDCVFCGTTLESELEKLNDECTACHAAHELEERLRGMDHVGDVCRAILDAIPTALRDGTPDRARRLDNLASDLRSALASARLL